MEAKFKLFDYVEVSGTATGIGDIVGQIYEVNLLGYDQPYYAVTYVKSETPVGCDNGIFTAEKFLMQNEKSKEVFKQVCEANKIFTPKNK